MKSILFWLCVSSASAITNQIWSGFTNQPQYFYQYPAAQYYQQNHASQFQNGFQLTKNAGPFNPQPLTLEYVNPMVQKWVPRRNPLRFPQTLTRNFAPRPQRPQETRLFYGNPNVQTSNTGWIPTTIKNPNRNTLAKSKKKEKSKPRNKKHKLKKVHHHTSDPSYEHSSTENNYDEEIPTKPIYPGEGKWAKPGVRHRPHVTNHKFKELDEGNDRDMGQEIFEQAKADFAKQKSKFDYDLRHFPQKHNLGTVSRDYQDDYYDDASPEEFVPYKTYSQVRKSETEKHLSSPPTDDERLKESITDSKTHTIYSEEGYEDSAYDHANQEKKADSTERYSDAKNVVTKLQAVLDNATAKLGSDKGATEESTTEFLDSLSVDQQINSRFETTTFAFDSSTRYEDIKGVSEENFSEASLIGQIIVEDIPPNTDENTIGPSERITRRDPENASSEELIDSVNSETKFGTKISNLVPPLVKLVEQERGVNLRRRKRTATNDEPKNNTKNPSIERREKYPYYDLETVDENSPLRYSENERNMPDKTMGGMAFYDRADRISCDDDEVEKVNPIPDRAKQEPKLGKVGDKIDCFKTKYFGENPLDNPFFDEDVIEAPRTIFADPSKAASPSDESEAPNIRRAIHELAGYEVTEGSEDSLDGDDETMIERIEDNVARNTRTTKVSDIILGRYLRDDSSTNFQQLTDRSDLDIGDSDAAPNALPYIMKYRRKTYRPHIRRKYKPKYIPAPSFLPLSPKRISEVHYKDEIKPSEQLTVLTDIINNIKNSSKDAEAESSNTRLVAVEANPIDNHHYRRRKLPNRKYRTKSTTTPTVEVATRNLLHNFHYTSFRPRVTQQYRTENQQSNSISEDASYENPIGESFSKIDYVKDQIDQKNSSWTPMMEHVGSVKDVLHSNHRSEESATEADVYGLMPPRETHRPQPFASLDSDNFYVIGMKPPPIQAAHRRQNHIKKRRVTYPYRRRIVKRNARRGYAEIRRGGNKPDEAPAPQEEEEEDYVPHRSKSYHYDVEKGRIVYDKKPDEEEEDDQESYEYVDVIEEVTQPTKRKKEKKEERILKFPDKPAEGSTYIDFIKQLKGDPTYHEIPDPKPTEKTTTSTTSTETPGPTTEPEFLSILAKVRGDASYKQISDPEKSASKSKPATEEEIEEAPEIEEEEEDLKDVQNSPGGHVNSYSSSQLEVVDISEYLPKTKIYSPSTNIDTSKYKSIERVTITRHNMNREYDVEQEPEESIRNADRKEDLGLTAATTLSQTLSLQMPTSTNPPTEPITKTNLAQEEVTQSRNPTARGRRRSTTTTQPTVEEAATERSTRSRGRGRFRSTTSNPPQETRESTRRRRNLQRNLDRNFIPKNHKAYYSPVEPDGVIPVSAEVKNKVKQIVKSRPITLDTVKKTNVTNVPKKEDVDVFENFDENRKHGGNYKYVTNAAPKVAEENDDTKREDVNVFKNFDRKQKHGGNYKYKKVAISVRRGRNYVPPTAYEIEDSEEIKRLSDVVPKPFAFYSDPKLPSRVNRLKEALVETAGEDLRDEPEVYEEAVQVNPDSTNDEPVFIKDPSKRLYFYAPI